MCLCLAVFLKSCGCCKQFKKINEFSKKAASKDGYASKCKECHRIYSRDKWYPRNRDKHTKAVNEYKSRNKAKILAWRYDVSEDDVKRVIETQTSCQICGSNENLCLDHCHFTGSIRGILCGKCNSAIGLLGDCIEIVGPKLEIIRTYLTK